MLVVGGPRGYPIGHEVAGYAQIPTLKALAIEEMPTELVSFDDRSRATQGQNAFLHFFKADEKLKPFLKNPLSYTEKFINFGGILTPDITFTAGMPTWKIHQNIWYSRAIGVIFQKRGFRVIPTVRWNTKLDYEVTTSGLERGGVIAVSNYGSYRNPALRKEFMRGLDYVLGELSPAATLVYGTWDSDIAALRKKGSNLIFYPANPALKTTCSYRKNQEMDNLVPLWDF